MPVSGGNFRQKFQMVKNEKTKKRENSKAVIKSVCYSEGDK